MARQYKALELFMVFMEGINMISSKDIENLILKEIVDYMAWTKAGNGDCK